MRRRLPASIELPPARPRWATWVVLAAIVALAGVCRPSRPAHPGTKASTVADRRRYHNRTFRVTRVVDGDTLDIDTADGDDPATRIRLWGVDTPELAHGGRPAQHFAAEASAFADQTLSGREVHVVLSPHRTRGKYGRLLAYVFLEPNGRMFNEMLLDEGYAYADRRFDHHYFDQFKQAEKRARDERRGLWADVTPGMMPEWRRRMLNSKDADDEW